MGPKRNPPGKQSTSKPQGKKSDPKRKTAPSAPRRLLAEQQQNAAAAAASKREKPQDAEIDLSEAIASVPVSLQQLLLNVFRTALLPDTTRESDDDQKDSDLHTQIQTLKTHLYNRDFGSAFADASPELLRAYALRWSASRCLAYVGIFKGVVPVFMDSVGRNPDHNESHSQTKNENGLHVLCIGGGAGAEIVALAGVWRALLDEYSDASSKNATQTDETKNSVDAGLANLSLVAKDAPLPKLSITAVDVAGWSSVVDSLSKTIHASTVPGQKACPSPLLKDSSPADISFRHLDVLSLSEPDLASLLSPQDAPKTNLVSLMFTLNELFSTSMPKTTQLLLRITDETDPGTILLIVDSPGSYSTLSLGGGGSGSSSNESAKQRQYPMKFLLEHTLLTVAQGKWEKMLSQDSRWFRREASKLTYSVNLEGGDGLVKLEDMRYQIHVYRRLSTEVK